MSRRQPHFFVLAMAIATAMTLGCSGANGRKAVAPLAISVAETGPHASISDPVDLVLRFHNNSKKDLLLPLRDLAPEENLFFRLSRRDPIAFVQSSLAGHRDVLAPFSDTQPGAPIRIPPGESYDYRLPRSTMLPWIFVARDFDDGSDLKGRFYFRAGVKIAALDSSGTTTPSVYTAISPPIGIVFSDAVR